MWKQVSPYTAGIGIASGVVSFNVSLYYNTIIAWCLSYFVRVRSAIIMCCVAPSCNSTGLFRLLLELLVPAALGRVSTRRERQRDYDRRSGVRGEKATAKSINCNWKR